MKQRTLFYLFFAVFSMQLIAQETTIFEKGKKAPNVHHTGDVWLNHLKEADSSFNYNVVLATFAPNAILDWHLHPGGQQLLITEGVGYYQERGKRVQTVTKGDVISCLPNIEHWHASTPNNNFTYIAITANEPTKWLEKVNPETYNNTQPLEIIGTNVKLDLFELSKKKWQWMAEKKVDDLENLFHEKSVFVHMGGSWGKEQELNIIKSGGIWYKKADIHTVSVEVIDDTAILLNKITLLAEVGGNEVTNPFEVTEVYVKQNGAWKLTTLSFTKLLHP